MRRHLRVLLCMSVVACVCALSASAASAAAPELGRCVKVATGTGEYSNAGCTTSATGSEARYKWLEGPGSKAKFVSRARDVLTLEASRCKLWKEELEKGNTKRAAELLEKWKYTPEQCEKANEEAKTKTPVILEPVEGPGVECLGETASGEYTGPKTVGDVKVTFTGCYDTALHLPCQNEGAASGEVSSTTLQGVLGVIKAETNPVNNAIGIRLEAAPGNDVSDFECEAGFFGPTHVKVTGSVIHEVRTNHMLLIENEKFIQRKGFQKPENFQGSSNEVLYSNGVQSGEGLLTELENEEKIEVNSVV